MEIIVRNGVRKITGSVADKKAIERVRQILETLEEFAGGELAEAAKHAMNEFDSFNTTLATEVEWAKERQKSEA